MSGKLEIIPLTKLKLEEALVRNTYWNGGVAPMSKSRAQWILENPRFGESDYCGVLGLEDGKVISFIYMLPEYLNTATAKEKKVYFMHLWWVSSKFNGTPIATYIYNEALNLANQQIVIKSYAEGAENFYSKLPFKVITERLRYTIFFSLDSSILLGRFQFLKKMRYLVNGFDTISYRLLKLYNNTKLKKRMQKLICTTVENVDDELWKYLAPCLSNDLIYKDQAYFNWHINENQYLQVAKEQLPYQSLLSDVSYNIKIFNLVVKVEEKPIGFISLIQNYKECNVRYFLVFNERDYDKCVDALMQQFIKMKSTFIFTDDARLTQALKKNYTSIFIYSKTKKGLAHKAIDFKFEERQLTSQDAHYY